ncbi:aminotransferase class I/II-fold pyridoxal phosphate-dependent enzyme [Pseudoalteromonas sp. T1lg24]|uniref:aminotransferase class I/II-fold pyridoxal phosphate-dependent enzyme n=1 Tax=Pseudoalteromonas sp. T1lg24 TaxID=2077099 RepID=UPI000CF672AE|nr:8-amino-7-oxononanoate synthase [Pseudoalteromonas sp. T1lg24]
MAFEYLNKTRAARQQASLYRQRIAFERVGPRFLLRNNTQYLNFASNDYLGLGDEPITGVENTLGASSSSLVTGYQNAHIALENYLKSKLNYQACLLFNSGFSANASVLKSLMNEANSEIFQDKLNHASLIDGGLAANATNTRFNHNDLKHLTRRLEKSKAQHKLIVSEGVFSMDGDSAPVAELAHIAKQHNAWLMIDDAHGFGVMGNHGLGSCDDIKPEILIITFGKACASSGAAVLCSQNVADYLLQFNRDYTYSTAMSPWLASATLSRLERLYSADEKRARLKDNIAYFKTLASNHNLALMPSNSAIQPLVLGDSESCLALSEYLKSNGIWLTAIRPPTVPHNTARLRITLTAAHQAADIEQLINQLVGGLK